jgi:fibronectin type 3 domain-containing protein
MVRDGKVFLKWSIPGGASDEDELAAVKEFWILREETPRAAWCDTCPDRLERFDVLKMDKMDPFSLGKDRVLYHDRSVSYGHVYVYRVMAVTGRGDESEPSNRAVIEWEIPPEAPSRVEGSSGDRTAILGWGPVEGAEGYRIYRKEQGNGFGHVPIARVGPKEFSYRDTGLSEDLVYDYTVRSVRTAGRTSLEGPGSRIISVIPRDLTPPKPPRGLVAIPLATGIELSWQRNTESDLLGYFVYRKDREETRYRALNKSPLGAAIYIDRTAIREKSYRYAVTAVDRSSQRNESAFSESVRVVYVR